MTYKNPDPTSDAARTDPNTADEAREKLRTRQKKACETPEKTFERRAENVKCLGSKTSQHAMLQ